MAAKLVAFSAFVASAAAFTPALAGVRTGATSLSMAMDKTARAPVITVFDHRGCTAHKNAEYTGPKTGDQDDEMCVKVYRMSCRPLKFAPSLTRAFRDPVSCMPDSFAWNTLWPLPARANLLTTERRLQVSTAKIAPSESAAAKALAEAISLKAKGIDGPYTGKA